MDRRRWAGLRSFTSERIPLAGLDPLASPRSQVARDLPEGIAAEGSAAMDLFRPARLR
ncbi:MAG TPA: hypothetical protein VED46_00505 [Alphaproteobacteria bacterium]|nr:hypothetical protein [Alphaproteobacteria bacterium]